MPGRTVGYESGNQPTVPVAIAYGDPQEETQYVDQDKPLPVKLRSETAMPDGNSVVQASTTYSKFTDGFNYIGATAFDPDRWTTVRQTGVTVLMTAGTAVVTVPAAAGSELLVVGKVGSTIPANLMTTLMASSRNTTTSVRVGYVAVDPVTGVPIPHDTIPNDFAHRGNANYAIAAVTSILLEAVSSSSAVKTLTIGAQVSTAAASEMTIELRAEDMTLATATPDSIVARAAGGRLSSQVPGPNLSYRPFIWIVNTALSVAATWTFYRLVSMDIQELQAEVGGGRGNSAPSQGIPVTGTVNIGNGTNVANRAITYNELGTVLAANQNFASAARALSSVTGTASTYIMQRARVVCDQACTVYLEQSWDAITWYPAMVPVPVTPTTLGVAQAFDFKVAQMMTNARIRVVNGAVIQGVTQISHGGSENG